MKRPYNNKGIVIRTHLTVTFGQLSFVIVKMTIVSAIFICMVLFLPIGISQARVSEKIQPANLVTLSSTALKTIIVANYYPYTFVNDRGIPDGFSVDIAKACANVMDSKIVITVDTWENATEALADGSIDFLPMMAASPDRDKLFDFSAPHTLAYDAVFSRKGEQRIRSLKDLAGKTVIVMNKDAAHDYLLKSGMAAKMKLVLVNSLPDALRMLAAGQGDAALMPKLVGMTVMKKLNLTNLNQSPVVIDAYNRPFCFAVKDGNQALLERFSQGLSIIKSTGQYQEIYTKWFGAVEPPGVSWERVIKYTAIISAVFLLIALVLIFSNVFLRKQVALRTKNLLAEIQERKRAEEEIIVAQDDWENTFESVTDMITIHDMDYNIVRANPAAKSILGLRLQDGIPSVKCFLCYHGTEKPPSGCASCRTLQTGKISSIEIFEPYLNKHLEIRAMPRFGKDQQMIGLIHIVRDITERKRAEEEKTKLEAQLFQSQKMEAIGTLAGGIAHDFNNILAVIIGYAELARDKNQKENKEQYLQEVLVGAERAKNLVKQILTFSRQEDNEKKPLDIKVLLKEAVKFLRSSIPTTVEINQQITREECNIMADPTQMHQVIMNLCTNAAHAMKQTGGILKLELNNIELAKDEIPNHHELQPGHYAKLTVSDTGYGIDPAIIQSIFDPFFTTKSVDEGTGLGLSVVYGIIKSHGGVINVYSEPGKGANFNVYLPRIIHSEAIKVDMDKPVIGGTERILFVDDEPALVKMAIRTLFLLGYQASGADGSMEALDLFRAEPQSFDLVITDMTLPKMTGIDLSREILKIRPDIPIILCSGIKEPGTEAEVKSLGIKAYLTKPLTRRELSLAIREVLEKRAEGKG